MNISNISISNPYSCNTYRTSANSCTGSTQNYEGAGTSYNGKDKVNISAEGMTAMESSVANDLEKLRMPSWFSQYYPKQLDMTASIQAVEETRQLFKMHDDFNSDGNISKKEQNILDGYRAHNMNANQTLRENHEFIMKYDNELSEYGSLLNKYYEEAKEEQGITSDNFYEKVLQAKGDNESLHQSFRKNFLADSRVLELANELGIKLST